MTTTHELRFVFRQDIRAVLDHFSRLLAVRFCFLSADGRELQVGEDKPHCRFCRLVRQRLGLADHCLESDRQGWRRAASSGRAVWYQCHAGLIDGGMAVRTGDRVIGYMMLGQFRTRPTCPPELRQQWRQRVGNDDLYKAYLETPLYTEQQVDDIMGVFSVLVDFTVSQRLVAVRGPDSVQHLLTYLAEHPRESLSTAQAAQLLHRSPSSFSHTFKEATGRSFLQYQIATRLDQADELLRTRDDMTVQEVAAEVGFHDPYYFSRLYRRHRGYPPSQARRQRRPNRD